MVHLSLQLMAKLDSFSIGKQKSSKRKIDAELRDVLRIAEVEVRLRRGTDCTFSLHFLIAVRLKRCCVEKSRQRPLTGKRSLPQLCFI